MANLTIKDIARICGVGISTVPEQLMMTRELIKIQEKEY